MRKITFLVLAAAIVSGCLSESQKKSPRPTVDQLLSVGNKMIDQMLTDRNFLGRSYPEAKRRAEERGEDIPTITVDSMKSAIHGITDYAVTPVRDGLKVKLRKTGKFSVKDVDWSDIADYGLSGELIRREGHCYLRLRLLDYAKDNIEIWNEFVEVGEEE